MITIQHNIRKNDQEQATMVRNSKIQPLEKEFGEQLSIKTPDFTPKKTVTIGARGRSLFEGCSLFDQKYELSPELPSHIPTPATIDQGLEGIQRQFENMWTEDDGVTTTPRRRRKSKLKKNAQELIDQQHVPLHSPGTPDPSPYSTKAARVIVTSQYGSKWGPEVWKSKLRLPFADAPTAPPSPSDSSDESVNTRDSVESPGGSPKLIVSEDTVGIVERETRPLRKKKYAASPLQLQWIEQNALNLHSSCDDSGRDDQPSSRRSRFFRSRAKTTAYE